MLQEINKEILIYLNTLWNNYFIEKIVIFFVDLPIFFIPLFLVFTWIYYTYKEKNKQKKQDLLFIFYWVIISIIFALIIQQIVNIDRPETVLDWIWKLLIKHIPDASFPSDHATVSFAFLTWLFFSNYKKIWYIFLIFALIMNLSRVIAWIHWPFDVIVWMIIWIIWSLISFKILYKIKNLEKFNNIVINTIWYFKL